MDCQFKKLEERLNLLIKKEQFKNSEVVINIIDNSIRGDDPGNKLVHVYQRGVLKFGTGETTFTEVDEWIPKK